jgi:hypothetical protein
MKKDKLRVRFAIVHLGVSIFPLVLHIKVRLLKVSVTVRNKSFLTSLKIYLLMND